MAERDGESRNMNRSALFAMIVLLLFTSYAATTRAETFAFKGIEIGSPIARITADLRFECRAVSTPIADRVCSLRAGEKETIAGAPIDSMFLFYDRAHLTGITLNFAERHFHAVVSALRGRYGEARLSTEAIRNLSGAPFENRIHHWRKGESTLVAQRYAGRIDRSSVRFVDERAAARLREHRARLTQDPGQDL